MHIRISLLSCFIYRLGFEPVGQDGIADDDISALPFAVKSDSKLEENKDFKKVPSLISVFFDFLRLILSHF